MISARGNARGFQADLLRDVCEYAHALRAARSIAAMNEAIASFTEQAWKTRELYDDLDLGTTDNPWGY